MSDTILKQWMEQALQLAAKAEAEDEVPVGAILVRDNAVIGEGYNRRENTQRTMGHAECLALENFNQRFSAWRLPPGTQLFVTVEPCLMCLGALIHARVDEIYFGCKDTKNAALSLLLPHLNEGKFDHRIGVIQGGVLEKPAAELISGYFRKKRAAK